MANDTLNAQAPAYVPIKFTPMSSLRCVNHNLEPIVGVDQLIDEKSLHAVLIQGLPWWLRPAQLATFVRQGGPLIAWEHDPIVENPELKCDPFFPGTKYGWVRYWTPDGAQRTYAQHGSTHFGQRLQISFIVRRIAINLNIYDQVPPHVALTTPVPRSVRGRTVSITNYDPTLAMTERDLISLIVAAQSPGADNRIEHMWFGGGIHVVFETRSGAKKASTLYHALEFPDHTYCKHTVTWEW